MSNANSIFTDIYKTSAWGSVESASGPGSTHEQTVFLKAGLPWLLQDLNVKTLLDLPCGDFNWMKDVDLSRVAYIGADLVQEIIEKNQVLYSSSQRVFQKLDLINDELPKVDAIFCRDCLVHLPNQMIFEALRNICLSGSTYLLTTTYSWPFFRANDDIEIGQWRRINLEKAPFSLPPPIHVFIEGSTESSRNLADKSIGVWMVSQIKRALQNRYPELV